MSLNLYTSEFFNSKMRGNHSVNYFRSFLAKRNEGRREEGERAGGEEDRKKEKKEKLGKYFLNYLIAYFLKHTRRVKILWPYFLFLLKGIFVF